MDSSRAGNLRSDRARLHGRSNDPLLLRSRPTSASLHRRDHFNLRLGHRSSPRITPSTCPNDSALQGGPHRVLTPRLEIGKELLRFVPMLKADDSVVRVAHDNHVASGASLPPLVDPLIIDMMEVNVCQERADDRAL